jgi:hypothetical protein
MIGKNCQWVIYIVFSDNLHIQKMYIVHVHCILRDYYKTFSISAMISHNQPGTQVSGKDWKIGEGATSSAGPENAGSRF